MLCKVLKKEKVAGARYEPNTIRDVPDNWVDYLEAHGVVERLSPKMRTTLLESGVPRTVGAVPFDPNSQTLIRND